MLRLAQRIFVKTSSHGARALLLATLPTFLFGARVRAAQH